MTKLATVQANQSHLEVLFSPAWEERKPLHGFSDFDAITEAAPAAHSLHHSFHALLACLPVCRLELRNGGISEVPC